MELPITVMIMFVVAIAVGIGILGFSKTIISEGKSQLNTYGDNTRSEDEKLIKMTSITPEVVSDLASQCAMQPPESPDKYVCFIVSGPISDVAAVRALNGAVIEGRTGSMQLDVQVAVESPNALFIYFDPLGTIQVTT